jgi:hypothetical protein
MIQSSLQQAAFESKEIKLIEFGLITFIVVAFCLKFRLIFQISINQDEFGYLSRVYSYTQGNLTGQFQTFHVHFFKWISYFSKNEVTQIIVARLVMYLFFFGTCLVTYLIGRQFINRPGALFAVLCFVSFSYVVVNGASFRSDTISVFLCLFSTYFVISKAQSKILMIIAGIALALSLMVTIKSVFHLLTIGIIFLYLLVTTQNRWNVVKQITRFGVALMVGFFLFYQFHISKLVPTSFHDPRQFLGNTSSKVIILNKLFPKWRFLELSICQNSTIWILILLGIILVIWFLFHEKKEEKTYNRLILFAFLVPVFSLIFYRNAFPYYYVFILSPAIIFCGIVFHNIIEAFRKAGPIFSPVILAALTLIVFFNFVFYYLVFSSNRNFEQKRLLKAVHEIFPEPVSYIDGCSMVSSFPMVGFFMSSWGMENYLKTNKPIMRDILIKHHPLFVLANVPHLNLSLPRTKAVSDTNYSLLEEDWNVLKLNFLHHWGPIYVAGKQFEFSSVTDFQRFEILIPGKYTFEGEIGVSVDGIFYRPGDIINLNKGEHTITAISNSGKALLRWGKHLYIPPSEPPLTPIFFGSFL